MPNVKQIEYVCEIPDYFHLVLTERETIIQGSPLAPIGRLTATSAIRAICLIDENDISFRSFLRSVSCFQIRTDQGL